MKCFLSRLALFCLLCIPCTAFAQDIRTEQVHFAAGASGTTIRDQIVGYESVSYIVGAEAGQKMTVALAPSNLATYFNVYGPGSGPGGQAIANSGMTGAGVPDLNRFEAALPASGNYTISVYMMRAAARRGERSDFTLDIAITGATGEVVQGDYADGLAGGPDFYAVKTSGSGLNLRAEPSAGAALVTLLANGTNLRNLGCRMAEGRRWCRVATLADPGYEGWAAGEFLIEGSGDASASALPLSNADMPSAADQACLQAVTAETGNPDVVLLSSSYSEAGTEVIVGVGPQQARWQCIAYSDGSTTRPMSLTDEGAL